MANAVAEGAPRADQNSIPRFRHSGFDKATKSKSTAVRLSKRSRVVTLCVVTAVLLVIGLASIAIGSRNIPVATVADVLLHTSETEASIVVHEMRIPRTLAGLLAGAALAVSGMMLQALNRNPLADPHIQGLNAGAALAVVLAISILDISDATAFAAFGLLGAAISGLVVNLVAMSGRGKPTPARLALAGAAITAMLSAITSGILLLDVTALDRFRFWVAGSLAIPDAEAVAAVTPILLLGFLLAACNTRSLDLLLLSDDVAVGIGHRRTRAKVLVALAVVLLAGTAVSLVGPIGFVGLAVPHIARRLVGTEHRWLLPCTAILGSSFVLAADVIGRVIARPSEIEAGIITALVGVPVFIMLIRRRPGLTS